MNRSPLLSIVVPTKNRYKYLRSLITFFEQLHSDAIELVIQDNTEENHEITAFLSGITNPLIKYRHHKESLTINENSDLAVANSTGQYVCYLGDDDGVLPNILEAVCLMEANGIDALTSLRPNFMWPDVKGSVHWQTMFPHRFPKGTGRITYTDVDAELKKLLKRGMQDMGRLPRLYHGIVSRDMLDRVREISGTYFPGASPDMANAVALSLLGGKCVHVDYPFIIAGMGKTRIHGNEAGDRQKSFESLSFLDPRVEKEWEQRIPKIWTVHTIYPETALKVIRLFNKEEYLQYMDYARLYFNYWETFRQDFNLILPLMTFRDKLHFAYAFSQKGYRAIFRRIVPKKVTDDGVLVSDVEYADINDYIKMVSSYVGAFEPQIEKD